MNRNILACLLTMSIASHQAFAQGERSTIADNLPSLGLTTLQKALEETGVLATLRGKGPYTLFAPSNSAFLMLGKKRNIQFFADKKVLRVALLNHIVLGKYTTEDLGKLPNKKVLKTIGQGSLVVFNQGTMLINGSKPYLANKPASNGIIQIMDRAMLQKVK